MLRRLGLLMAVVVIIASVTVVSALTYTGSPIIDCTGFIDSGAVGSLVSNRDNTGGGRERITVQVVDGSGRVIYSETRTDLLRAWSGWGPGSYSSAPKYNPIRLYFISEAGNGFKKQVIFAGEGNCAGLPTFVGENGEQVAGPPAPNLSDGRLNNSDYDVAAPIAVYCAFDHIDVYKIDQETGAGERIIHTPEDGSELPVSEGNVLFSLLETGEFQINTYYSDGKPYIILWEGCDSDTLQHQAW